MTKATAWWLEAALALAARGWRVHPLHHPRAGGTCSCTGEECRQGRASAGKHPRLSGFLELASTDRVTLEGWAREFPEANLGLVTGAPSGVDVLDIDGQLGRSILAGLEDERGPLPYTPTVKTGSGGRHYYFRHDPERPWPSRGGILPKIDTRGSGGNVVAPPSRHFSGSSYSWLAGRSPGEVPLAAAPAWLTDLVAPKGKGPATPPASGWGGPRAPAWSGTEDAGPWHRSLVTAVVEAEIEEVAKAGEGTRNDTLYRAALKLGSLEGAVRRDGGFPVPADTWDRLHATALAAGLSEAEIVATIRSGRNAGNADLKWRPTPTPRPSGGGGASLGSHPAGNGSASTGSTPGGEAPPPEGGNGTGPATPQGPGRAPPPLVGSFVDGAFRQFADRNAGREVPVPVPWAELAENLGGGLWPGLFTFTSTTGVGKTQFALQLALGAALAGHPVAYVGLELDPLQLVARLLTLLACRRLPDGSLPQRTEKWSRFVHGKVPPSVLDELRERHGPTLATLPLRLELASPYGWSYAELDPVVRSVREATPPALGGPKRPPLVVLDFLQLVSSPLDGRGQPLREDLRERIAHASNMARQVAKDHGAAVLCVSSSARENYALLDGRKDKDSETPSVFESMSPSRLVGMGKESGEIEYSADAALVLTREPWNGSSPPEGGTVCHVFIAKGRAVPTGRVRLTFDGNAFREAPGAPPPPKGTPITSDSRSRSRRESP